MILDRVKRLFTPRASGNPNLERLGRLTVEMGRNLERGWDALPRIVQMETRSRCNGTCSFCLASVGNDPRPDLYMSEDLIGKILDELSALEYPNRLSLYNNNEPLMDKRIFDVIHKARKWLPYCYLEIKSNGTNMTIEKLHQLFDAGLDMLFINDYRTSEEVEAKSHRPNVQKILDHLQHSRRFKGHFDGSRYYRRVVVSLRLKEEKLDTRAGNAPNRELMRTPKEFPCLRPFEQMIIAPDGGVALCCDDLKYEELMGNVTTTSLMSIWKSPEYNNVRAALLAGDRSCKSTCARCDYRGYTHEILHEFGV